MPKRRKPKIFFEIFTIFPGLFSGFLKESLIFKARQEGLISIGIHNLRQVAKDKHLTVDDKVFGGGSGMLLRIDIVWEALKLTQSLYGKGKFIVFSPRGEKLTQKRVTKLSQEKRLYLLCARYEGVDERVLEYMADEVLSIGDYVLMGGEVPAMVLIESVARLIPGVVQNSEILGRITKEGSFIEYPQYTRPRVFSPKKGVKWEVPEVLFSGDHQKIKRWREEHKKEI